MARILFMGGKPIGHEICKFLLSVRGHEIRYIVNDYERPDSWYRSPRRLPIPEIAEAEIATFDPELIVVAFYDKILKGSLLSRPRLGAWNLHLADAERYRGAFPSVWALRNGDRSYGVTLHRIDRGIDTGPILAKRHFDLPTDFTGKELYEKMVAEGRELFVECFDALVSGRAMADVRRQSDEVAEAHYRRELSHELDVSDELRNQVRALTFPPFPPPHFMIGSRKFVVVEAPPEGADPIR